MLTSAVEVYVKGAKKEGVRTVKRKQLVAFVLAILIVTALVAAGCGSSTTSTTNAVHAVNWIATERMTARYSFLTNAEQLEQFLPPGYELWGDPIATLDVDIFRNFSATHHEF